MVQVDLGSQQTFDQISFDAGPHKGAYPAGYRIQVSNDGLSWLDVAEGLGSRRHSVVALGAQTARYILITQTGNQAHSWRSPPCMCTCPMSIPCGKR